MESKPTKSPEFDRFTALVDQVLSVPKAEIDRQRDAEKQPVTKERRLLDLRYLREEIEGEESRKSQVVPKKTT
jgi:hypothetical protein